MIITGKYPNLRLRRTRQHDWSRRLIQENNLSSSDLILPIFLTEGKNKKTPVQSMPGVYRYSINNLGIIVDKAIKKKYQWWHYFHIQIQKLKIYQDQSHLMKIT